MASFPGRKCKRLRDFYFLVLGYLHFVTLFNVGIWDRRTFQLNAYLLKQRGQLRFYLALFCIEGIVEFNYTRLWVWFTLFPGYVLLETMKMRDYIRQQPILLLKLLLFLSYLTFLILKKYQLFLLNVPLVSPTHLYQSFQPSTSKASLMLFQHFKHQEWVLHTFHKVVKLFQSLCMKVLKINSTGCWCVGYWVLVQTVG